MQPILKDQQVAIVSNPSPEEPHVERAGVIDVPDTPPAPARTARLSKWYRLRRDGAALIKYLLDSEVHTFAFSVAANAILSFVPFVVLLYTLAHEVFHSQPMVGVVNDMVDSFFPTTAHPHWLTNNLVIHAEHFSRHGVQVFSILMILISCTGIFLPLEVALNQAWGVKKSRNYLVNQTVAFGLAIWMVILGIAAMLLSAGQRFILDLLFFHNTDNFLYRGIGDVWLALCSGAACIVFFFSIYWILPNCKVPAQPIMRASVVTGLIWLAAKYIFAWTLPHIDLQSLYGPFYISVSLLFWGYISGLILFAGAQFSVARMRPPK
jgi:YihY family inner membrane protein